MELTDTEKDLAQRLIDSMVGHAPSPRYQEAWNYLTDVETNEVRDWDWALGMLVQMLEVEVLAR